MYIQSVNYIQHSKIQLQYKFIPTLSGSRGLGHRCRVFSKQEMFININKQSSAEHSKARRGEDLVAEKLTGLWNAQALLSVTMSRERAQLWKLPNIKSLHSGGKQKSYETFNKTNSRTPNEAELNKEALLKPRHNESY